MTPQLACSRKCNLWGWEMQSAGADVMALPGGAGEAQLPEVCSRRSQLTLGLCWLTYRAER